MQALPGSGSAPLLRTRVEDTNRRYERLVQLLDSAQEKWVAGGCQGGRAGSRSQASTPSLLTCVLRVDVANRLEKSLQQGRDVLAKYENQLTQDDTVPESGRALDSKRQELAVSLGALGLRSLSPQVLPPQHLGADEGSKAQGSESLQVWRPALCQTGSCMWRPWHRSQLLVGLVRLVEIRCCYFKTKDLQKLPRFPVSLEQPPQRPAFASLTAVGI